MRIEHNRVNTSNSLFCLCLCNMNFLVHEVMPIDDLGYINWISKTCFYISNVNGALALVSGSVLYAGLNEPWPGPSPFLIGPFYLCWLLICQSDTSFMTTRSKISKRLILEMCDPTSLKLVMINFHWTFFRFYWKWNPWNSVEGDAEVTVMKHLKN